MSAPAEPSLAALQAAFRAAILGSEAPDLAALVVEDGIAAARRIQVYRNNTFISLTEALGATFPVVRRLVGEDFFAQVAHAFIRAHPPRVRALFAYGDAFPAFLESCPGVEALPYLGDVARLEWAWNEAYHAADAPALDPARLAGIAPEAWAAARFRLHPSARLLASAYPVAAIWRANQPEAPDAAVDLGAGGEHLLVIRPAADVLIVTLAPADHALLGALADGASLAAAVPADADPTPILAAALAEGFFAEVLPGDMEEMTS